MTVPVEIVRTGVTTPRLTLTPTRATLKVPAILDAATVGGLTAFVTQVRDRMLPITKSWRGQIQMHHAHIQTSLCAGGGTQREYRKFKIGV